MEIAEDALELGRPTLRLGLTIFRGAWGQVLASQSILYIHFKSKIHFNSVSVFFLLLLFSL